MNLNEATNDFFEVKLLTLFLGYILPVSRNGLFRRSGFWYNPSWTYDILCQYSVLNPRVFSRLILDQ